MHEYNIPIGFSFIRAHTIVKCVSTLRLKKHINITSNPIPMYQNIILYLFPQRFHSRLQICFQQHEKPTPKETYKSRVKKASFYKVSACPCVIHICVKAWVHLTPCSTSRSLRLYRGRQVCNGAKTKTLNCITRVVIIDVKIVNEKRYFLIRAVYIQMKNNSH